LACGVGIAGVASERDDAPTMCGGCGGQGGHRRSMSESVVTNHERLTARAMAASAPVVIGQQRAIRTVSNISAQDKASGAKQHPELMKQLQETGDKQIGNADARDSYWGIGTSTNTEKSQDPSKWKGQNQLGKIIMELRRQV
jgi:predicted NAD-dependent protein-ADP-ribosyltransferase YbiA (DUF1768 family)